MFILVAKTKYLVKAAKKAVYCGLQSTTKGSHGGRRVEATGLNPLPVQKQRDE